MFSLFDQVHAITVGTIHPSVVEYQLIASASTLVADKLSASTFALILRVIISISIRTLQRRMWQMFIYIIQRRN